MSMDSYKEANAAYTDKVNSVIRQLPSFIKDYLYAIESHNLPRTCYRYLYDTRQFFAYLIRVNPTLHSISEITPEYLNQLRIQDFNEYLHDLRTSLSDKTVARRISSLKSLFRFLLDYGYIENQDFLMIKAQKIRPTKGIVYLDRDESQAVLRNTETGDTLTKRQKAHHKATKLRDQIIITLLLGTGMRVSECAALDIKDVNLENQSLHLIRKGMKETYIYFSDELKELLETYLLSRRKEATECPAMFLNRQKERLSVRSIEILVKKYAPVSITGNKRITPHKLRSSYATALYEATGDLYITAEVLGHESVETTKKYYANLSEERKKRAGRIDTLHSSENNI